MLPKKEFNIYPKSDENLKALISFYLDKYDVNDDNGVEILKEKTSLSLNEIEFIFRKLSEAYIPVFQKHLKGQITVANLIKYAIDALTETKINGSKNRILITNEFEEFVRRTEIDFTYLENNN
jgi:hypothetical protein